MHCIAVDEFSCTQLESGPSRYECAPDLDVLCEDPTEHAVAEITDDLALPIANRDGEADIIALLLMDNDFLRNIDKSSR